MVGPAPIEGSTTQPGGSKMAIIAMTTSDTLDYVSDIDPAKVKTRVLKDPMDLSKGYEIKTVISPGATVFKLRSLDVFLKGMIYDSASVLQGKEGSAEYGIHTKMNATNIDDVRHGLLGFENFTDNKGIMIVYETTKAMVNGRVYDVASDKTLNTLGIRLIQEMASEIKKISEVTAAEEKNSAGVSAPSA